VGRRAVIGYQPPVNMERDAWGVINVALHDWLARPCHHHPLKTFPLRIVHQKQLSERNWVGQIRWVEDGWLDAADERMVHPRPPVVERPP
jgi:endo-1,4-beta-mannosidase